MNTPLTVDSPVHFRRRGHGRLEQVTGAATPPPTVPPGRVPRVARLAALALRFEGLVRSGAVASYTELATLGHVTRARVSQVMNLLNVAPDVLEALLFLPRTQVGRAPSTCGSCSRSPRPSTGASSEGNGRSCAASRACRHRTDAGRRPDGRRSAR